MLKKLAGLVTNNFGLKVLGAVFAVILWLAIVNTADPDKSATFSVPVQIINAEYLTDAGKTYEVIDNTETISFTVTGKRSIVETLSTDDFKATANMENIDDSMTMVPITLTATRYSSQLDISVRDTYLMLNVENLVTKQFDITAVTSGDPAENCFVESVEISPENVTVSGPESVVDQIDDARVYIYTEDANENLFSNESVSLVDESGSEIDQSRLSLDASEVVALTTIWMKKTIPVSFEVTGDPADGYLYNGIDCDVDSITIQGESDTVSAMEELVISTAQTDISGADKSFASDIYLPDLLPDGVELADDEPTAIEAVINIEEIVSQEFAMPVRNLSVTGPDTGYDYAINSADDTVTVKIDGLEDDLAGINANRISGSIDLSGLDAGSYIVPVTLSDDYGVSSEATVSVTITKSS